MAMIRNFRTARLFAGVLVIVVMGLGAHQLMASSGGNMAPNADNGLVIGEPPPSCPATLGDCKQIKNSCCYRCPGNFIICIDF